MLGMVLKIQLTRDDSALYVLSLDGKTDGTTTCLHVLQPSTQVMMRMDLSVAPGVSFVVGETGVYVSVAGPNLNVITSTSTSSSSPLIVHVAITPVRLTPPWVNLPWPHVQPPWGFGSCGQLKC